MNFTGTSDYRTTMSSYCLFPLCFIYWKASNLTAMNGQSCPPNFKFKFFFYSWGQPCCSEIVARCSEWLLPWLLTSGFTVADHLSLQRLVSASLLGLSSSFSLQQSGISLQWVVFSFSFWWCLAAVKFSLAIATALCYLTLPLHLKNQTSHTKTHKNRHQTHKMIKKKKGNNTIQIKIKKKDRECWGASQLALSLMSLARRSHA